MQRKALAVVAELVFGLVAAIVIVDTVPSYADTLGVQAIAWCIICIIGFGWFASVGTLAVKLTGWATAPRAADALSSPSRRQRAASVLHCPDTSTVH